MLVRLKESYQVADSPAAISVKVGQAQLGYVSVVHEGQELEHGAEIENCEIGEGSEIRGTELRVSATVTDTNPNTNETSITYVLTGGAQDRTYRLRYEVEEGGVVRYYAKFRLL